MIVSHLGFRIYFMPRAVIAIDVSFRFNAEIARMEMCNMYSELLFEKHTRDYKSRDEEFEFTRMNFSALRCG